MPKSNSFKDYDYIFQGTRNLHYIPSDSTKRIAIIGSWSERKLAKKFGYGFIWSFPIKSSLFCYRKLKIAFFLDAQYHAWLSAFSKDSITLILIYEDNLPIGAFLSHITRSFGDPSVCKTICIQHGYFCHLSVDAPLQGSFTDYNLLWDLGQVDLVGCDPMKSFEIGPPVLKQCLSTEITRVVLVGSGSNSTGNDDYARLINFFVSVLERLPDDVRKNVSYRPHPNEMLDPQLPPRLKNFFGDLDLRPKEHLLAAPVAIFIGSISSLLYEAHFCGHTIISIDGISSFESIAFEPDFRFKQDAPSAVASLICRLFTNGYAMKKYPKLPKHTFESAITLLGSRDL